MKLKQIIFQNFVKKFVTTKISVIFVKQIRKSSKVEILRIKNFQIKMKNFVKNFATIEINVIFA